jgi:MFS family permease
MDAIPSAAPTPPERKPGLLINRGFALLFTGSTISFIGDYVFNTTLVLWIAAVLLKGQTWAPLAVSGGLIAAALPVLLVGPLAGVFVDRWDKRRTAVTVLLIQAIAVTSLLPLAGLVRLPLPAALGALPFAQGTHLSVLWTLGAIYAVVFTINACNQFMGPATIALIGDLVAEPLRPRATSLDQVAFALAAIIGPPIAAPLLFGFGVQWAVVVDALSFLGGFLAVRAIRAPKAATSVVAGERGHFARELRTGLRFFLRNRVLRTLGASGVIVYLAAGALNALDYFFWVDNVHGQATLYGLVGGALAAGVLLGAVLGSVLVPRIGLRRSFWLTVLALGVLVLIWSRMTNVGAALAVIFLIGLPQAGLNIAISPLMLEVTPRELVGRVTAIIVPLVNVANLIALALAGYLASTILAGLSAKVLGLHFGPLDTIFGVAGLLCIVAAVFAMVGLRAQATTPTTGDQSHAPAVSRAAKTTNEGTELAQ